MEHPLVAELRAIMNVREESRRETELLAWMTKALDGIDRGELALVSLKDVVIIPKENPQVGRTATQPGGGE